LVSVEEIRTNRKGKLVVVAGINGVGKTTVLSKLKDVVSDATIDVFNYGDVMLELAVQKGWVENRDQLRKLPLGKQFWLQKTAAEALASKASEKNVVVDTHVLVPTKSGLWPGLPKWVVEGLVPDVIVIIEAPAEITLKHRQMDKLRERRDQESVEEVKTVMELNRSAAFASAVLVGAAVLRVENIEGDPSKAAGEIVKLFNQ
jgi:adenylate kinase